MLDQQTSSPNPDTIDKLRFAADGAFAMLAGMQLDVFTPLKDGPKTADQIAQAIGVRPNRLRLLLYALVPAGLLDVNDGFFANTAEADRFLVRGSAEYVGGMPATLLEHWSRKLQTADSIRTGRPQAKIDFSNAAPAELEAFLRRINGRTVAMALDLLERFDFSSVQTIVDVGGGAGGFAATVARACPQIQATVIDLPLVTPIAKKIVAEEGLAERVQVVAADVVSCPLPGSYDAAVLKALIQVLSPEDAQKALRNIGAAINPGGTIYIVGQILDDSRISPLEAVGQNLVFINDFDAGESYTEQEHRDWLTNAGFVDIRRANFFLTGRFGLITGRRPM